LTKIDWEKQLAICKKSVNFYSLQIEEIDKENQKTVISNERSVFLDKRLDEIDQRLDIESKLLRNLLLQGIKLGYLSKNKPTT
jgi:hypothetical protein